MDRRPKPSGITLTDLNAAVAEAHFLTPTRQSHHYWRIKRQIAWEHRQKILAGQRKARAEGKKIGRPPVTVLGASIDRLRQRGWTWKEIGRHFKRPTSTVFRRYDMYLRQKGLQAAGRYRVK